SLAEAIRFGDDLESGRRVVQHVVGLPLEHLAAGRAADVGGMQEAHVRRIQQSLEPLQPVAMNDPAARRHAILRQARKLEIGKPRGAGPLLAEIDPDQSTCLVSRMASDGHAGGEAFAPGAPLGRCIDALAVDRELPTMEDASQAVLLIPRERQTRAAVWAGLLHETDAAIGRPKSHEVLAEQSYPLGRAVDLQLGRAAGGHPVLAQQLTHRCAWPDAGQKLVVLGFEHAWPPEGVDTLESRSYSFEEDGLACQRLCPGAGDMSTACPPGGPLPARLAPQDELAIDGLADRKSILADLVEPVASIEALRCEVFRPHSDVQGSSPSALEPLQPDIHQLRAEAQIVMACE